MMNLLVVRHAQSVWNASGRWQGQADPPLSEQGIAEALAACDALTSIDAIVASDLERSGETARIMAEALGLGPVVVEPRIRERLAGAWQGLTRPEIERDYPGCLESGRWPPGWEDEESVLARALEAIAELTRRFGSGNVLAISHGGVLAALESHVGFVFERTPNLAGRWFEVTSTGLHAGDRVRLLDPEASLTPLTSRRV